MGICYLWENISFETFLGDEALGGDVGFKHLLVPSFGVEIVARLFRGCLSFIKIINLVLRFQRSIFSKEHRFIFD